MQTEEKTQRLKSNTKFIDEFSEEIYKQTYKYGNEDINETHLRVARDLASVEKDKDFWISEFLWALEDSAFLCNKGFV